MKPFFWLRSQRVFGAVVRLRFAARTARFAVALFLAASSGSCSLTVAAGFNECTNDGQCASNQACLQKYCVQLADGCFRAAGMFQNEDRIAMAAVLPLTQLPDGGLPDESEQAGLNAISLAVEEGNQRQGIRGRQFALYACNTSGDDEQIKRQVDWMVKELKVPAILTSGSGQTIAAATVAAPGSTLVMSATATSPELVGTFQSTQRLVWRTAPSDTLQARVIAELINTDTMLPAAGPKVAIAYVNSTYGQGLSAAVRSRLPSRFTLREFLYERNGSINDLVNQLASFGPNLTVLIGFPPDIKNIVNQAKTRATLSKVSGHRWLFSDSAKDPSLVRDGLLSELSGMLGTAPAQGDGKNFPTFSERFEQRYGVLPANFSFTSHSYDAMYLLMLSAAYAARDGDITGPRMADGLTHVSSGMTYHLIPSEFSLAVGTLQSAGTINVEGSSGALDFDLDAGSPPSRYEVWRVLPDAGFITDRLIVPPAN